MKFETKRFDMPKMKQLFLFSISSMLVLLMITAFTLINNPDAMIGYWRTGDGKAIVQVYKQEDKYFGKIVWLAEPNDPETGKPKLDKKNEEEKLRTRPILGMVNLRDFKFIKKGVWEDGKIYDPKSGNDYSCEIKMTDENTLEVRGYVGISMFGRTDTWKRQRMKS
ncbi:MAG: DUF2147 domain-containing protein [Chitinophagaceae bacterium]|nr:DUF2147 domain-containing protein [Chitinophagaceae bacterium]